VRSEPLTCQELLHFSGVFSSFFFFFFPFIIKYQLMVINKNAPFSPYLLIWKDLISCSAFL